MEKRAETPTLYITGQGRVGIETAKKLDNIFRAVNPGTMVGLDLSDGKADLAKVFFGLGRSGSQDEAVMVHTFSYDRDNAQAVADYIASAKQKFPEIFHLGMVLKPVDPLSARYFRQTEQHPLERLGIPLTVLDQGKAVRIEEQRKSARVKPEDIVFYGIAGLFRGHAIFPELNPHTPREILESLTDQTNFIGISVGQNDHYYPLRRIPLTGIHIPFLPRHHMENEFSTKIDKTIADALWTNEVTPFERQKEATPNILAVQVPLKPEDSKWKERPYWQSFIEEAVEKGGLRLAVNSLVMVFSPIMTPIYEGVYVSSTAALFYPGKPN